MVARRCLIAIGVVALALAWPALARAQPPAEVELRARLARQPADIGAVLDLARLYVAEQRYDDAMTMTQRAAALIRQQQTAAAGRQSATAGAVFTPVQGSVIGVPVAPEPAPPGAVRVGGDVREPKKIRDVKPAYPPLAQAARVQGIVVLEATIGHDGSVTDARVVRGVALLDDAALAAVRQWQFTPTLINGVPVDVIMTVTVNFSLAPPLPARLYTGPPPVRVGGDIKTPTRTRYVPPVYPEIARAAQATGVVIIETIIDEAGKVVDTNVLRGVPLLNDAAIEAVKQWEFTPTLLNGAPVPVVMTVTVSFDIR